MKEHSTKEYTIYKADEDAEYTRVIEIDLSTLRPTVAPIYQKIHEPLMK